MPSTPAVLSHWNVLIENLSTSTTDFYDALRSAIESRKIPDVSISKIDWRQSHWFSPRRGYLKVSCYADYHVMICGAPYGTGFFVSSWLLQPRDWLFYLASQFPLISSLATILTKPWTFYRIDTATMFRTAVHAAVLEVIDSQTTAKGLPMLPDSERKPIMREFFGK